MVTLSTDAACRYIVENLSNGTPYRYLVESNFNADKTRAAQPHERRGHHVIASFQVPNRVLKSCCGFRRMRFWRRWWINISAHKWPAFWA